MLHKILSYVSGAEMPKTPVVANSSARAQIRTRLRPAEFQCLNLSRL